LLKVWIDSTFRPLTHAKYDPKNTAPCFEYHFEELADIFQLHVRMAPQMHGEHSFFKGDQVLSSGIQYLDSRM
jgi:hypothetical protein